MMASSAPQHSFVDELAEARAASASTSDAHKRMRRVRGCDKCDCFWFVYAIRILSAFTGLGVSTISVFGFFMADGLFKRGSERVPGLYGTSFAEFGIFTGVVSVYFVVFGLLIVAAELRMASIKQTVLAHVSFLSTFIGRGAFYLLLGTLLLLPGHVASRVIGGLLLACGLCQLVVSAAVSKDALQLQEVEDDLTSIFSKPDPKERGQARTKVGAKAAQGDVESSRGTRVSRAQSGAGKAGRSTSTVETANPLGSTSAQRSSAVPSSHSGSQGRDGGAEEQRGPPPSGSADNPFLAME